MFRIADQTDKDDRFVKDCRDVFHEFEFNKDYRPAMKRRSQWVGDESNTGLISVPYLQPCLQWLNITVTCTDEVPHCCMDGAVEFPMGNLKDQGLLEIYNGKRHKIYRDSLLRRESVYPCNSCSLW